MNGDPTTGIEDIMRRNVAALRSKANLTQQGLADEMLLRGIAWTRETVAQVETTNRRLGFTEAIVVAACLDVPVARLTATGAPTVVVGEGEWTAAYLGAALAGTAGDIFPPESYASPGARPVEPAEATEAAGRATPQEQTPDRRRGDRRLADVGEAEQLGRRSTDAPTQTPQRTAERIERRLRLRVTAGDVDATAQRLWSRSLESERERRVTDRHALTGGSLKTIRGHVSRDLDREIAYEMERHPEETVPAAARPGEMTAEEATWEATRLNIILANKGYSDSDVTRWWNFTKHHELGDRTMAEAWAAGEYAAASRLVESLPDKHGSSNGYYLDE
ncbi:MAG: helix-turn-helix transcriptional regulator [Acidimicrobiales bacterium]|nr:helix-turn-helix transcriptional regulator [Acidimicrobiales bacterium]